MPTDTSKERQRRLGELLIRRRLDLDPRYRNRQVFAYKRGVEYRIVSDIERGRRMNFHAVTIAEIERAYALTSGAISRFMEGGDLEPLPPPAPPRPAVTPDMERAMLPHVAAIEGRLAVASASIGEAVPPGGRVFPDSPRNSRTWDVIAARAAEDGLPPGEALDYVIRMLAIIWTTEARRAEAAGSVDDSAGWLVRS